MRVYVGKVAVIVGTDCGLCVFSQESKTASNRAKEKAAAAERMQRRIQLTRGEYQPIANRAACLYFIVTSLVKIDSMYQFSLDWFVALFQSTILKCTSPKRAVSLRVRELTQSFTYAVFQSVSRALFSKVTRVRLC